MQPDSRLARLAQEGNVRAFEEIVRRYRPRLVAFAAAIVPPHRAEDIVQESLERVFAALRDSSTEVHLRPWLYTIVRNRSLNAVRDERVHVELDEEHDGVTPPPEILARREEVAALVAGIQALPEAQRQALVGRELEGLSHDQIAAQLGTSPDSVRGLIFRARTAVRHGAGAIVPLPILRWLLSEAPAVPGAGEAATAGGLAAAGAVTAGTGGGGFAVKAGAIVAAGVLAAGAGVGIRDSGDGGGDVRAEAAQGQDGGEDASSGSGRGLEAQRSSEHSGGDRSGPSGDDNSGPGGGEDDNSGPGGGDEDNSGPSGDDGDDDRSGPGGGGDGDDSSGPGGGGTSGGHSGPGGGGEDEVELSDDDNSGPGGGGTSGSGSGDELDAPDSDNSGPGGGGSSGSGGSG